jgi:hypothetical protein
MRVKLMTVISNSGNKAIVAETFAEIITPAEGCSAADFLDALKPGSVMQIPLPQTDDAASRVASLRVIGNLNQIRADLQKGEIAKADAALALCVLAYVKTFTDAIAAGKG